MWKKVKQIFQKYFLHSCLSITYAERQQPQLNLNFKKKICNNGELPQKRRKQIQTNANATLRCKQNVMLHACFLALFVNVIVVLVANAFHRGISSEQNCYRILLSQLLLFVSENIARIHKHIHLVHMQLFTRCFHLLFVVCLIILRKAQVVRYFCAQTAMNMQKANSLFIFSEKAKYYLSKGNNNNVVLK